MRTHSKRPQAVARMYLHPLTTVALAVVLLAVSKACSLVWHWDMLSMNTAAFLDHILPSAKSPCACIPILCISYYLYYNIHAYPVILYGSEHSAQSTYKK